MYAVLDAPEAGMEHAAVDESEYLYRIYDFEDCRLIECVLPNHIDESTLSVVVWRFLEHYQIDKSIAVLSDYRTMLPLSDVTISVLRAMIETSMANPRFVGAVWVTGPNERVATQLRELLRVLGLPPGVVVHTHGDGLAILRRLGATIPGTFELSG